MFSEDTTSHQITQAQFISPIVRASTVSKTLGDGSKSQILPGSVGLEAVVSSIAQDPTITSFTIKMEALLANAVKFSPTTQWSVKVNKAVLSTKK